MSWVYLSVVQTNKLDHGCCVRYQGDSGYALLALLGLSPQSSTRTMHGVMHVGRPPAERRGLTASSFSLTLSTLRSALLH